MLELTVGLIVVCLISVVIAIILGQDNMFTMLPIIVFIMSVLFLVVNIICTIEAKNKAEFYNKNFGTSYTTEDVYFNGTTINDLIIGEKKNLNIKIDSVK
jgi:uncharacterized membrane protein YkvI